MNTILQKRIDSRAVGIGLEFRDAIVMTGINRDTAEAVATMTQTAAHVMAEWMLKHLWISVEEALPDKGQDVLVVVLDTQTNTQFFGFDAITNDSVFLRDKNGFPIEKDYHKITHWMPIPELPKGGEK